MNYTILDYKTFDANTTFNSEVDLDLVNSFVFTNVDYGCKNKIYHIMYEQIGTVITNIQPDITSPCIIQELKHIYVQKEVK